MSVKQKKNQPPLFLTDNIKMGKTPTKMNWKIHVPFTLYFMFWKYSLQKIVKYNHQIFFFLLFLLAFTPADIIFHKFLELHTHYLKKRFSSQFFFLTDSHKVPHLLNRQNLLILTSFLLMLAYCYKTIIELVMYT